MACLSYLTVILVWDTLRDTGLYARQQRCGHEGEYVDVNKTDLNIVFWFWPVPGFLWEDFWFCLHVYFSCRQLADGR